jgi:hypothetical protein
MPGYKQFLKELERRAPCKVRRIEDNGATHLKVFIEGHNRFLTIARTPSDHRALQNAVSDVRRALRNTLQFNKETR